MKSYCVNLIGCFNLIPLVRLAPKGFRHNCINLNDISHAHIVPNRDGTTFHLIVLFKVHVYFKQITWYTYSR